MSVGRRRGLRRHLTVALVFTALVSLVSVGTINFLAAYDLLNDGSRAQLVGVAESRVVSIERGLDNVLARTSTTGADQGVVDALVDFSSAVDSLNGRELTDDQRDTLDDFYRERVIEPLGQIDIDVTLDQVAPTDDVGRYLQYHHTLPTQTDTSVEEDTSSYARALEQHDDFLRGVVERGGVEDLLLIDLDGRVVYTSQKFIDLGASLQRGLLSESNLAEAGFDELPRVRVGDSVVADFERYLPGGGQPALFVLVAMKDGVEPVGVMAMRIPVDGLNAITTADGQWERVGLGDGETYVVSADRLLLSESRAWIEDPDDYLDRVDDPRTAQLIEAFQSPVGLQEVDTRAVDAALDGETFAGQSSNYLGEDNFSYARRVAIEGLDWVVVAEQPVGELRAPLWSYLGQLGVVFAVLLPVAAVLGWLLADRLTRSIVPVVRMAERVVEGERNLAVPDLGANEVGDLARQLDRMARQLGEQEAALEAEFEERRRLLGSVLPERLVDESGEIGGSGQAVDTATVVALIVDVELGDATDEEYGEMLASVASAIAEHAARHRVEKVRAAADRFLLVAGIGEAGDAADRAVEFVRSARSAAIRATAHDEELTIEVFAGVASGTVATGVLEQGNLTFGVWGEPVRRALAIAALSTASGVLIDESTVESLDDSVELRPAGDVVALDGERMALATLAVDTDDSSADGDLEAANETAEQG